MAKLEMVVTGDKALNRKLKRLAGKDAKKAVRKATRPALKPVLQEARSIVPIRTGNLKKNIKIRALPRSRQWVGARATSGAGKVSAFYGTFLEFGTKKGIQPRRYMKRAADKKKEQTMRIYRFELGNQIKELGRRG